MGDPIVTIVTIVAHYILASAFRSHMLHGMNEGHVSKTDDGVEEIDLLQINDNKSFYCSFSKQCVLYTTCRARK